MKDCTSEPRGAVFLSLKILELKQLFNSRLHQPNSLCGQKK